MLSRRVNRLLDAYFNRPLEEYVEIVLSVKERGGLSSAEVRSIKGQLLYIHAYTILRHVELA